MCVHARSLQLCPALCDPRNCSWPGFSVHWVLQARLLDWVAVSSSGGSSQIRDQTCVSCVSFIGRQFFTASTTWAALTGDTRALNSERPLPSLRTAAQDSEACSSEQLPNLHSLAKCNRMEHTFKMKQAIQLGFKQIDARIAENLCLYDPKIISDS